MKHGAQIAGLAAAEHVMSDSHLRCASVAGLVLALAPSVLHAQLRADGSQIWTQDSPRIEGRAEEGDLFGWALAAADFNNDGFDDLAVGVRGEDISSVQDAGAVNVILGGPAGLTAAGNRVWAQSTAGIDGEVEFQDRFGNTLAACDFDGDNFDDLAIGILGEGFTGSVQVMRGAPGGLEARGNRIWSQATPGILGVHETGDHFGVSLACGDFNHDGYSDLAAGAAFEEVDGVNTAGGVNVIYGSADGLTAAGDQFFTQNSGDIDEQAEFADLFGRHLAAGDFNNDGYDDLAVSAKGETIDDVASAGSVTVLMGSRTGLLAVGSQTFHQDPLMIPDGPDPDDRFGSSLTAADFNNDGFDDLAIGSEGEDAFGVDFSGTVIVLFGGASGIAVTGREILRQSPGGLGDERESGDTFGHTAAAGDFDNDGFADLVIGVSGEGIGARSLAGLLHVVHGRPEGFDATQTWSQESPGIDGEAQSNDLFSESLAAGDFNRDGFGDLAIGVPGEDVRGLAGIGQVHVIYGGPPGDTADDLSRQRRAAGGIAAQLERLQRQLP